MQSHDETEKKMLEAGRDETLLLCFLGMGAYQAGERWGEHETQVGALFRGCMGCANYIGMTAAWAERSSFNRVARSMFMEGYSSKTRDVSIYTDIETGRIARVTRQGNAPLTPDPIKD